jgi:hypothetical protein
MAAATPTSKTIPRAGDRTGAEAAVGNPAASWPDIEARLGSNDAMTWLSLATEKSVHTRPVFAAWTGTSFVHATNPEAVKTRYLEQAKGCSLAFHLDGMHLAVDARPSRLTERGDLERAVAAFQAVYEWPTEVTGDLIDAPYAAPSSGGPPFRVYELTPIRAFAFPAADQFEPTRFTF